MIIVFSDDWGRHPSSCQHLVRQLLGQHSVLWVNTIGMRPPRLSLEDLGKASTKMRQWLRQPTPQSSLPANLKVINPGMYPGFRRPWQRRINQRLISRAIHHALGAPAPGQRRIVVTTIPVISDLIGHLQVDRWVYYCVDDFSVWPGLDGAVIDTMERQLVQQADRVVAVSSTLQQRMATLGAESEILTHGIDLAHWGFDPTQTNPFLQSSIPPTPPNPGQHLPDWWSALERPIMLFWGVVDRRLDTPWCQALAQRCGSLVLVGPQQSPDPQLSATPRVCMPGPVAYADLPALAKAADMLVMPYADLPVTRAIQPLKFKEYLATGKPTLVRKLPATADWSDTADVVETLEQLVDIATTRASHGTPAAQLDARRQRLVNETWLAKAQRFEQIALR